MTANQRRWLKRWQAVEPVIGALKAEHRMRRNHLNGQLGDAPNVVLAAAGYNLRWLMRWLVAFCAWFWSGLALVSLLDRLRDALERLGSAPAPARFVSTTDLPPVAAGNVQGRRCTITTSTRRSSAISRPSAR